MTIARPLSLASLLALTACSYSLHETAHTLPAGASSLDLGASLLVNDQTTGRNASLASGVGAEIGPLRVGLSDHVDMGIGFLYTTGGRVDTKVDVFGPHDRFALAPRFGAGYAAESSNSDSQRKVVLWMLGLIASYDVSEGFTPYAGATFANHWVHATPSYDARSELLPSQQFAARTGEGNGLLELAAGLRFRTSERATFSLEYSLWAPMQDDPGDFYAFTTSHVISGVFRLCITGRCP